MEIEAQHKNSYLIYNRKSTDDPDNQQNSLTYQQQRNNEFAIRNDLPIATSLTIAGFCTNGIINESHSAFKEEDEITILPNGSLQYKILRPKFRKLVELLATKQIKGVIFLSFDRASRNKNDTNLIEKLISTGSDMRFTEVHYQDNSSGKLHRSMDGLFSEHYSTTISEKVHHANDKLRAEGKCIYMVPIGYLDEGSSHKPLDPVRAPIVKRIFELYATGEWSFRELARWANEQGLTQKPMRRKRTKQEIANEVSQESIPKLTRKVTHKTIEYILSNPFYIGKLKVKDSFIDSKAHQPLIDIQLFKKVQEVLQRKSISIHYADEDLPDIPGNTALRLRKVLLPLRTEGTDLLPLTL